MVIILGIIGILLLLFIIINQQNSLDGFSSLYSGDDINHSYANLTNNSDNPWTIEKTTKLVVINILNKILKRINEKTHMTYIFTAFDQLQQDIISTNEVRFVVDFFVHEMQNLISRRIIIIFTVNYNTRIVSVEHINLSNTEINPL